MARSALLLSLVFGVPALVSCLVGGGFQDGSLAKPGDYKDTQVGAVIDEVNKATADIGAGVSVGIGTLNSAFDSLKNTSKSAAHDITDALVSAGNRIMQMEKRVNWLRELKANKTKKEEAHKKAQAQAQALPY